MHFREVDLCCLKGAVPHAHDPRAVDLPQSHPPGRFIFPNGPPGFRLRGSHPPVSRACCWALVVRKSEQTSFSPPRRQAGDPRLTARSTSSPSSRVCEREISHGGSGRLGLDLGEGEKVTEKRKKKSSSRCPGALRPQIPSEILYRPPHLPSQSLPGVWDGRDVGVRRLPKASTFIRQRLDPLVPTVASSASRIGRTREVGGGGDGITVCGRAAHPVFLFLFCLFIFPSSHSFFPSRQATAYARRHALGAGAVTQRP